MYNTVNRTEVFSSQIFCLHPGTLIALNVAVPESETSALKIANVSMDACNEMHV